MDSGEWGTTQRWTTPRCLLCDSATETTVIYQADDITVQGWRCPRCGFTFINPNEIPKALEVVRNVARIP